MVDTYRVYLRNGQEYRRETLCTSNYRPIQQEIEYNDEKTTQGRNKETDTLKRREAFLYARTIILP